MPRSVAADQVFTAWRTGRAMPRSMNASGSLSGSQRLQPLARSDSFDEEALATDGGPALRTGSNPGLLSPVEARATAQLEARNTVISGLRTQNRSMEKMMERQRDEASGLRRELRRMKQRQEEKQYVNRMLKSETEQRIKQDKKIESLKSVLDWGDVGKRHEVEGQLKQKVLTLDKVERERDLLATRNKDLMGKNRMLATKLGGAEGALIEQQESYAAMYSEAEAALKQRIYGAENEIGNLKQTCDGLQKALVMSAEAEAREVVRGLRKDKKLGEVNLLLMLQRAVTLKRAEQLEIMEKEIVKASDLLVERGEVPISTEWITHTVKQGFVQKLTKLADERNEVAEAVGEMDEMRENFAEMKKKHVELLAVNKKLSDKIWTVESDCARQLEDQVGQMRLRSAQEMAEYRADCDRTILEQAKDVEIVVIERMQIYNNHLLEAQGETKAAEAAHVGAEEEKQKAENALAKALSQAAMREGDLKNKISALRKEEGAATDRGNQLDFELQETTGKFEERDAQLADMTLRMQEHQKSAQLARAEATKFKGKLRLIDEKMALKLQMEDPMSDTVEEPKTVMLTRLKEQVGALGLTVRMQQEDIMRANENIKREALERVKAEGGELKAIEKVAHKEDEIEKLEKETIQLRRSLKEKFDHLSDKITRKDEIIATRTRERNLLDKELSSSGQVYAHLETKIRDQQELREREIFDSCRSVVGFIVDRAMASSTLDGVTKDFKGKIRALQQAREADMKQWRDRTEGMERNASGEQATVAKRLEQSMFEAGQAQSKVRALEGELKQGALREERLMEKEAQLAQWKADLFEKVDTLRSENDELENGLRMSAEEIERLQKRIMYLDARREELKEETDILAHENDRMRTDKRVAGAEARSERMQEQLASALEELDAKDEELNALKAKFKKLLEGQGGHAQAPREPNPADKPGSRGSVGTQKSSGSKGSGFSKAKAAPVPDRDRAGEKAMLDRREKANEKARGTPARGASKGHFEDKEAAEIKRYAVHLGMDLDPDTGDATDVEFLWLAEEALTAPLPPNWSEHVDPESESGGVYFFHAETRQSTWEHPMDDYYRQLYRNLKKNKQEMMSLMAQGSLFQNSQLGLKTNALLKEHNQVLASLMLAENPSARFEGGAGSTAPTGLRRGGGGGGGATMNRAMTPEAMLTTSDGLAGGGAKHSMPTESQRQMHPGGR